MEALMNSSVVIDQVVGRVINKIERFNAIIEKLSKIGLKGKPIKRERTAAEKSSLTSAKSRQKTAVKNLVKLGSFTNWHDWDLHHLICEQQGTLLLGHTRELW